jgi:hypothetical protein
VLGSGMVAQRWVSCVGLAVHSNGNILQHCRARLRSGRKGITALHSQHLAKHTERLLTIAARCFHIHRRARQERSGSRRRVLSQHHAKHTERLLTHASSFSTFTAHAPQGKAEEWKRVWGLTALCTLQRLLTNALLRCLLLRLSATLLGKAEEWKRTWGFKPSMIHSTRHF